MTQVRKSSRARWRIIPILWRGPWLRVPRPEQWLWKEQTNVGGHEVVVPWYSRGEAGLQVVDTHSRV